MAVLGELAPRQVFRYFEELCGIPHGSGNTKAISEYCMAFARRHGLDAEQDAYNNVLIRKPGSAGYENHPPVILQGHLDMVCEKEPECTIDFARDGLELFVEGDWIGARGTTLGGDDGIAVAMGLAILEDDTLAHPPLEVLFTTDEETGMDGAVGLDASRLKGRTLINADSEEEGVLTVGCAGGARAELRIPVTREPVSAPCYTVTVDGLIGGHSGAEIHKGRLNSNIVMGRFLQSLPEGFRLVKLVGVRAGGGGPHRCCGGVYRRQPYPRRSGADGDGCPRPGGGDRRDRGGFPAGGGVPYHREKRGAGDEPPYRRAGGDLTEFGGAGAGGNGAARHLLGAQQRGRQQDGAACRSGADRRRLRGHL